MRNNYRFKNFFIALLALSSLTLAYGGNIPQYSVSKNGTPYAEFSDGTAIPCQWNTGTVVIYPGNVETPNAYSAQGFPIGFDFRFGGRIFNQFVVSSSGNLYLGKDMVNYGDDAFRLGMSPMMYGVYRADISYKISGEEGDRVLTVQFKRAILDEVGNNKGKYSLQLRLHEADGTVEMAFKELETLYNSGNGFDTGLFGWDGADALQLYAAGLDSPVSISSKLEANMLESDSYIHWDCNDYDMDYAPVFVFSPVPESPAPVNAPDLEVSQSGTTLNINCVRADGADATVVLVSETPFTEADLPVDGETFRGSYRKPNGNQVFPSMLGNAKPLYYGNDQSVSLAFDNAVEGKTYYVKALSANGYPAYNRDNTADVEFITSQAAPRSLTAVASSQNEISISVMSDDPVIVAMSTEAMPGYQKGYAGVFGTPSPDAKTGDDIPGGGKVVYAGDPADFDVTTVPNELTYFRAWTVRNGHLSSTSTDAIGIAMPSYPYAPAIENYPFGEQLRIWEATENQFIPWLRSYAEDRALYAVTLDNQEVVLQTPELPLDCPVKVSFEFALETQRAAASGDGTGEVELPQGNEPGLFGDTGYLGIFS